LLAFSPFLMLALLAYGQEGVLRVYLFSLPWTAALAALALAPFPSPGKLATRGTSKPAQALATTLWVPRNGSSGTDDTVIFDRKATDRLRKAAAPARPAAGIGAAQASFSPAGSSEAAEGQQRSPAAPVPRPADGSGNLDDTMRFWPLDADGTTQATAPARPALDTAAGANRRFALTRQGRQIMLLMCLAAMIFIAGLIAVAWLGG
jgi:hypothetical protein